MQRILVLRGGALGDFIVTLPALALLRSRWPDARIELVGNATAAALACRRGLLDAAHSQHEARWSSLFGSGPLPPSLAATLDQFDLVVNYWPDPDGELRRRFPARAGQVFLHGEAMPARTPAAAHYCEPLRALGLATLDYHYPFVPPGRSGPRPAQRVAVHPGSGSARKNWPAERWLELIAKLPPPVLLILGEAEHERWSPSSAGGFAAPLRKPARDGSLHLAINLPLEDLVAQLSHCRLFLGHDSGVSHLAAACGVPSVLLFGPSDAAMWAPPTRHAHVLRQGEDLNSISVADVERAIAAQR